MRKYLVNPPRVRLEVDGHTVEGVTVVVQNADPFTYFGARPIRVCEGAALDNGTLSFAVLERASAIDMPTLIGRLFSARARTVQRHQPPRYPPSEDQAKGRQVGGPGIAAERGAE